MRGEFSNWAPLFSGEGFYRECSKCLQMAPADKLEEHLMEQHKYDLEDGIIIQVNNKWWRRRGTKTKG